MPSGKGSGFERDLARRLSLWWTHGADDTVFWRVLGSGGRATRKTRTGKGTLHVSFGDLEATCPSSFAFTDQIMCEFKRGYGRWAITDVLDARVVKTQVWHQFMQQVIESWQASGRRWWIVIFKRDQRHPMIAIDRHLFIWLYGKPSATVYSARAAFRKLEHGRLYHGEMSCVLMRLEDFLRVVEPKVFIMSKDIYNVDDGPMTKGWHNE